MKSKTISRRTALKLLASSAAGGAVGMPLLRSRNAHAQDNKPYFLITLTCTGGASMIDAFMPVRSSESANGATLNTFEDDEVIEAPTVTPIKAVRLRDSLLSNSSFVGAIPFTPYHANPNLMAEFAARNLADMQVVTYTGTSVNHTIAQKRALTGNAAWRGRTLAEAVAATYGDGFTLPNVNMGFMGYIENGSDDTIPPRAKHETVQVPYTYPLALDGARGIQGAPSKSLVDKARALRNTKLEASSKFVADRQMDARIQRWIRQRDEAMAVENADLITKLQYLPDDASVPLGQYGLLESPEGAAVRAAFPDWLVDPLEGQAALAFLLLKYQVSCAVTIGPNFNIQLNSASQFVQTPLAYDNSHSAHRYTQAGMWHRMISIADRLIALLKAEVFDPASGETFWDRSLIYFATEFGRTKERPSGATSFGSSHDLNNGALIVSPLVNGNQVLGGVYPDTCLTYGFDRVTGAAAPGTTMSEADIFAGLLQSLGIDTSGSSLPDMPAMTG